MDEIVVSIICNAYNHEQYIADAIEGFLIQQTNFKYEILIHDDASTDKTAEIIKEYAELYPDLIKAIYETENQYSKKDGSLFRIQRERVRGKYIAICEGDDYWTDPHKLQIQYDLLESNPSINMCAHNAYIVNAGTKKVIGDFECRDKDGIMSVSGIIENGGGYLPTCSLFYRTEIENEEPEFRKNYRYDYSLQILGALENGIILTPRIMSSYRAMSSSSWSLRMKHAPQQRIDVAMEMITMLNQLNEYTQYKYNVSIKKVILEEEYGILQLKNDFKGLANEKFAQINANLSPQEKLKLKIYQIFPHVGKLYRCLRRTFFQF